MESGKHLLVTDLSNYSPGNIGMSGEGNIYL